MQEKEPYSESILYAAEFFAKAIRETARKVHKSIGLGISHEQYIILETVCLNPGIIQIDIAKQILMKRSYVHKLLFELEQMGCIRKENGIRGKRQVTVKNFATEKGEDLYKKITEHIINDFALKASEAERDEIKRMTQMLIAQANMLKNHFNLKF